MLCILGSICRSRHADSAFCTFNHGILIMLLLLLLLLRLLLLL